MPREIEIRPASGRADFEACVALQREVWGLSDLEVTSAIQLLATVHAGGLLLVADGGNAGIAGFCYAFAALRAGEPHLHSDMLAVRRDARGCGLGLGLKWAQREHALGRGLRLVTWTFDPLRAGNARLNLRHLGATAAEFLPDFYGTTSSALHRGLPTDRLLARWQLDSPRVAWRAAWTGSDPAAKRADLREPPPVVALAAVRRTGDALPHPQRRDEKAEALRIEVPADWDGLCAADAGLAREWQAALREAFERALAEGLVACDFASGADGEAGYLLRKPPLEP